MILSLQSPEQLIKHMKKLINELKTRSIDPSKIKIKSLPSITDLACELENSISALSTKLSGNPATTSVKNIFEEDETIHLSGVANTFKLIMHKNSIEIEETAQQVFDNLYSFLHGLELNRAHKNDTQFIKLNSLKSKDSTIKKELAACKKRIELEADTYARNNWIRVANSIATHARKIHGTSEASPELFYISLDRKNLCAHVVVERNPSKVKIINRLQHDPMNMNKWLYKLNKV